MSVLRDLKVYACGEEGDFGVGFFACLGSLFTFRLVATKRK